MLTFPQKFKVVQLAQPQTSNGGVTGDTISLKNAIRAWIVFHLTQAVGHATVCAVRQATDVAAGTNAAGPADGHVWADEDVAASDALVRQTDGSSFTVDTNVKNKVVIIEVDPAMLTDLYDCVYPTVSNSAQATNIIAIEAIVEMNYQRATPPSVIVD